MRFMVLLNSQETRGTPIKQVPVKPSKNQEQYLQRDSKTLPQTSNLNGLPAVDNPRIRLISLFPTSLLTWRTEHYSSRYRDITIHKKAKSAFLIMWSTQGTCQVPDYLRWQITKPLRLSKQITWQLLMTPLLWLLQLHNPNYDSTSVNRLYLPQILSKINENSIIRIALTTSF
jgi:hypothetical protein